MAHSLTENLTSPGWVAAAIARVSAVLSVVLLLQNSIQFGLADSLSILLNAYDYGVRVLWSWADQPITELVEWLEHRLGRDLVLLPHWRHVMTVLGLYLLGDAVIEVERKRPVSLLLTMVIGGPIMAGSSLLSGLSPIDHPMMLAAVIPIVGFVLYEVFRSILGAFVAPLRNRGWGASFVHFAFRFPLTDAAIGLFILVAAMLARHTGFVVPDLVLLFLFLLGLALRNVYQAWAYLKFGQFVSEHGPKVNELRDLATGRLGMTLLSIVAGVLLVLVLNAGLALLQ